MAQAYQAEAGRLNNYASDKLGVLRSLLTAVLSERPEEPVDVRFPTAPSFLSTSSRVFPPLTATLPRAAPPHSS